MAGMLLLGFLIGGCMGGAVGGFIVYAATTRTILWFHEHPEELDAIRRRQEDRSR